MRRNACVPHIALCFDTNSISSSLVEQIGQKPSRTAKFCGDVRVERFFIANPPEKKGWTILLFRSRISLQNESKRMWGTKRTPLFLLPEAQNEYAAKTWQPPTAVNPTTMFSSGSRPLLVSQSTPRNHLKLVFYGQKMMAVVWVVLYAWLNKSINWRMEGIEAFLSHHWKRWIQPWSWPS